MIFFEAKNEKSVTSVFERYGAQITILLLAFEISFIKFITNVFHKLETEEYNSVVIFIANFIEKYKSRTLDINYYREFNPMSKYRYLDGETTSIDYKEDVNEIDISHNYSIITDLLLCVIINHKSELYKKGGKKWN